MNRLTREEACKHIGCSISALGRMERQRLMDGTYYNIGRRRLYITEQLDEWMELGGEHAAYERLHNINLPKLKAE